LHFFDMTNVFHLIHVICDESGQIFLFFFFLFKLHVYLFQVDVKIFLFLNLFFGAHEYLFEIVLTTYFLLIVERLSYDWVVKLFS